MGENTGGGQATATAAKPKRAATPKTPAKTPHQLRIERLFDWAMAASIAGHAPALRDPTLSAIDVSRAFTTWKLTVPGYIQRIAAARLVAGTPMKDIAAAETITVDEARQRFAKAMTSFESIIAKMEGPEPTPDEKSYVPVMRRVTGDRVGAAYMMRKANAEIERVLKPEMQDACNEIEFAFRYLAGELSATTNLRAYGILPGKGSREHLEDKAMQLVPRYSQWQKALERSSPEALTVCRAVVLDGLGLRQAAVRARLADHRAAQRLLLSGLNEYCIRAGWGDVLGAYVHHDPGYAYVIGASAAGPFKVGYSSKPKARMAQLQDGHAAQLTLMFVLKTGILASKAVEDEIRVYLKDNRVRADWYNAPLEYVVDALRIIHPKGREINH